MLINAIYLVYFFTVEILGNKKDSGSNELFESFIKQLLKYNYDLNVRVARHV